MGSEIFGIREAIGRIRTVIRVRILFTKSDGRLERTKKNGLIMHRCVNHK